MHTLGGRIDYLPDQTHVRFVLQLPDLAGNS